MLRQQLEQPGGSTEKLGDVKRRLLGSDFEKERQLSPDEGLLGTSYLLRPRAEERSVAIVNYAKPRDGQRG